MRNRVLQSPQGTAVALMANAGGSTDVDPLTHLRFVDTALNFLPNTSPITYGFYKPGSVYEANIALGLPAPQPPYATALAAFNGQPARGIWKLWVYDDASADFGEIESAAINLQTELAPSFTFTGQATQLVSSSDQPFVRFEGTVVDTFAPIHVTWRSEVNGEFYDAGVYTTGATTARLFASVPLKAGANVVTTSMRALSGAQLTATRTVNVSEFTYSLAEGATGSFFESRRDARQPRRRGGHLGRLYQCHRHAAAAAVSVAGFGRAFRLSFKPSPPGDEGGL